MHTKSRGSICMDHRLSWYLQLRQKLHIHVLQKKLSSHNSSTGRMRLFWGGFKREWDKFTEVEAHHLISMSPTKVRKQFLYFCAQCNTHKPCIMIYRPSKTNIQVHLCTQDNYGNKLANNNRRSTYQRISKEFIFGIVLPEEKSALAGHKSLHLHHKFMVF